MFDQLTTDELKSLAAAIVTQHGYSSNKMSRLLAHSPDVRLHDTYAEIATEIGELFLDVNDLLISAYQAA